MTQQVGLSGFAVYVPPYRVDLESWCQWTGNPWDKTRAVVGHSFRMRGPAQSVYTMAATAVMRLIESYDIDPERVGFLGLGTESSTDNSAGAVIVKGMLDDGLRARGKSALSRHCEVPEVKHACLGGVYALKHALRYLALDKEDRCAIVVSADIAEYARGSSGEPTQGAGAVAMLVERDPKLLTVHLDQIGSASSYRAVDFRKPVLRNILRGKLNCHFQDLPVFNGKYSTTCYVDETLHALNDMSRKMGRDAAEYYRELSATLKHWAGAKVSLDAVLAEMRSKPEILDFVKDGNIDADAYPLTIQIAKEFRGSPEFTALVAAKMSLGSEAMKDIGNVYCAALPAWIAAGLEDAYERDLDLAGGKILAIGYGSGDAAEAIPMTVARSWKKAAAKIGFQAALEPHQDLSQVQYENLHDTGSARGLMDPEDGFVIQSIGSSANPNFSDEGVEYYRFVR
jgi:hydroxymethylglutaryl-CoA synthase